MPDCGYVLLRSEFVNLVLKRGENEEASHYDVLLSAGT